VTGVLVKVCGLTRPEDVDAAVDAGADLVGFILVPWSPRAVDADAAARLRERVPDGVETVGVFVDEDPDRVAEVQRALGLDRVQLHGSEPPEIVARFGERAIKAYRLPHDGELVGATVLLDRAFGSEPSDAELAEHWAAARHEGERRRVLLAGALTPENVGSAVRAARPWAVDAVRGTEAAPGIKDHDRLRAFCAAAREGAT
jgi:phosphoribosylanthranilate isomerase